MKKNTQGYVALVAVNGKLLCKCWGEVASFFGEAFCWQYFLLVILAQITTCDLFIRPLTPGVHILLLH